MVQPLQLTIMPIRVLVTTSGGTGHIHPMVPLAQALVGRGHDVLWALPDRSVGQVEQAGVRAVGVTSMPPVHPSEVLQQFPELRELTPPERPDHMFAKLFGALMAPPMLAGLTAVAKDWRPDLVVSDAAELAGPLAAKHLSEQQRRQRTLLFAGDHPSGEMTRWLARRDVPTSSCAGRCSAGHDPSVIPWRCLFGGGEQRSQRRGGPAADRVTEVEFRSTLCGRASARGPITIFGPWSRTRGRPKHRKAS